jgi:hypothetical protein
MSEPRPQRQSLFTRLLILLIIVIVLLGATNLAMIGVRALDRPAQPQSGQLLYASTFDTYNQEWTQFESQMTAKIADGTLQIAINKSRDGAFSILDHEFADFDLRVNAVRVAVTDEYHEFGVLFRYVDTKNYYIFKIRGDGFYRVERVKDGQTDTLSEWHASPAILSGTDRINQLQIVGQGANFKFSVNDQPLTLCPSGPGKQKSTWSGEQCLSNNKQTSPTLADDSFAFGKIGVGVRVDVSGTAVAFDNVLVYGP